MKNVNITPREIFKIDQILTLEIAKTLIGKTIAVTNPEYKYNSPDVRIGKLLGIESSWDLAGKEDHSHLDNGKYSTRQDYWKSYMSEEQIINEKNRLKIVSDNELWATCDLEGFYFPEPTFFGSDADREIYFMVLENVD